MLKFRKSTSPTLTLLLCMILSACHALSSGVQIASMTAPKISPSPNPSGSATTTSTTTTTTTTSSTTSTTNPLVLASSDFENGTPYPFVYPWTQAPNDFQIVPDPTGARGGHVVQFHYQRSLNDSPDVNRAIFWNPSPGFGYGQTFYFRGYLYVPRPPAPMDDAGSQRKLLYWMTQDGAGWFVLKLWSNNLGVGVRLNAIDTSFNNLGVVAWDAWHKIEVGIRVNDAGQSNGQAYVWLDDKLVFQPTNLLLQWTPGGIFNQLGIGYQVQRTANDLFNEYRYWDDIDFSTSRLP